ncbi:hypothetical protein [Pseudomonas psychrophila]|uniref:Uncharacterized protein n=1 Tax=Pseudomonas psychrophila TaxID=122355 RepID=A0A8I1FR40_9PSED|nr:hypothetical protein [Pseudomonas psychrophila]MBJ2259206.1 hypothetical protein [Pseudomonas psychrophila]
MGKLVRVYDPDETERRINLILPDAVCPGLLEFMSELPYGNDTPLIRGVFYQWFVQHRDAGTLDEALSDALSGPGGLIAIGSKGARDQIVTKSRKRAPRQRSARGGGHHPTAAQPEQISESPSTLVPDHHRDQVLAQPAPGSLQTAVPDVHSPMTSDPIKDADPTSPVAVQSTEDHSLTVAQMDVGNSNGLNPDAEQIALLNSMGAMFP